MRIYLLRPVLLDLYRFNINQQPGMELSSVESTAHIGTLTAMAQTCLECTMAIIDHIYDDEYGTKSPSNLWWYGIYCELSSGTANGDLFLC